MITSRPVALTPGCPGRHTGQPPDRRNQAGDFWNSGGHRRWTLGRLVIVVDNGGDGTGVSVLTSTDVCAKKFRVALRGYAEDEVDVFLDRVVKSLWEYQADRRGDLSSRDVEQKTFRVALRGYNMEEVDPFLDRVVETLRDHEHRMLEELTPPVAAATVTREGSGPPAAPETEVPEPPKPKTVEPPLREPPTVPEPASTVTRLVVTRISESGGRPYTVLLDDQPIGKVSPDSTQRFEIPTGMHWITVKTRKDSSNNVVIEPHQGDQITLSCGPASGEIDDLGRKMEGIVLELVG